MFKEIALALTAVVALTGAVNAQEVGRANVTVAMFYSGQLCKNTSHKQPMKDIALDAFLETDKDELANAVETVSAAIKKNGLDGCAKASAKSARFSNHQTPGGENAHWGQVSGNDLAHKNNGDIKMKKLIATTLIALSALTSVASAAPMMDKANTVKMALYKLTCDNDHSDLLKATIDEVIERQADDQAF